MNTKRRNVLWTALSVFCALAALFFLFQVWSVHAEEQSAQAAYRRLRANIVRPLVSPLPTADATPPPSAAPQIDLTALDGVEDFSFWLDIPDTTMSYPVMQGADNSYYLNHLPDGTKNRAGSLFLDWRNESDLSSPNSVVYGHNMKDGTMFSDLLRYRDEAFLDAHPTIWRISTGGAIPYHILAAHVVKATAECYRLDGPPCVEGSQILTLSTCTGWPRDERLVVHGVRAAEDSAVS